MENVVRDSLNYLGNPAEFTISEGPRRFRTAVIGCGNTGCQILSRFSEARSPDRWNSVPDVLTVAVNATRTFGTTSVDSAFGADSSAEATRTAGPTSPHTTPPDDIVADERLFSKYPPQKGLSTYELPYVGEHAAEQASRRLKEILDAHETGLCIIIAYMGEGSGAGAAPILARMAREMGIVVLCIALCPVIAPKAGRPIACEGLAALRETADSVLVVDPQALLPEFDGTVQETVQEYCDEIQNIVVDTVTRICDLANGRSLVGVDYADVFTVFRQPGDCVLWRGKGQGDGRATEAVADCRRHPVSALDPTGAKGCIIPVHGGMDLTLEDAETAANLIGGICDPTATVVWGARADRRLNGQLDIMAIFSGLNPYG